MQEYYQLYTGNNWGNNRCHSTEMCIDKGVVVKLFLLPYGCVHMIRLLSIAIFMFPLFLTAETITVKTKAPQNRNAVFQYRVPRGYDKNRREMYRVRVIFGDWNTTLRKIMIYPYFIKSEV